MKNKFISIFSSLIFVLICFSANGSDQFNFDVKEIEILEEGNKFIGKNKGIITSESGVIIDADQFEYNKSSNLLSAKGNVKINDTINNILIFSDEILYNKNEEVIYAIGYSKGINEKDNIIIEAEKFVYYKNRSILEAKRNVIIKDEFRKYNIYTDNLRYLKEEGFVFTNGNSKAIDLTDKTEIYAEKFEYELNKNIITAKEKVILENKLYNIYTDNLRYLKEEGFVFTNGNSKAIDLTDKTEIYAEKFEYELNKNIITAKEKVILENKKENYKIISDLISYLKNENKIFTLGKTEAFIKPKYSVFSKDLVYLKNTKQLFSEKKTEIDDGDNLYKLEKFIYSLEKEELKGEKILISSNYKLINNDKFYFSSAIIDLKSRNFVAKDTKINIHKSIFNNPENEPRLYGVSSIRKDNKTIVKKGIFTNCKKNNEKCPPWSMQVDEIVHNEKKTT